MQDPPPPSPHSTTATEGTGTTSRLLGKLEDAWGTPGALPALQDLYLAYNAFQRGLPEAWGRDGSFPSLRNLDLSSNCLTGAPLRVYVVTPVQHFNTDPKLRNGLLFCC